MCLQWSSSRSRTGETEASLLLRFRGDVEGKCLVRMILGGIVGASPSSLDLLSFHPKSVSEAMVLSSSSLLLAAVAAAAADVHMECTGRQGDLGALCVSLFCKEAV